MPAAALQQIEAAPDDSTIQQRVAILNRLKEYLLLQRNKFQEYLSVLELEERDIEAGDADKLKTHTEMGKSIVQEIYAFQKVINPLEDMYRMAYPVEERELPEIRASLNALKEEVQKRNHRNIEKLTGEMNIIESEIISIKRPKVYNNQFSQSAPSLIDITT